MNLRTNESNPPCYSFAGAVTGITILTLFVTIPTCFFGFSISYEPEFNSFEITILWFLISIMAPIAFIPLFMQMFPHQKINFSIRAILKSLVHVIFFICSLPILLCFVYLTYITGDFFLKFKSINEGFVFLLFLIDIPIVFWIYVTLLIKEFIFGKNSYQTLKHFRVLKGKKGSIIFKTSIFPKVNYQDDKLTFSKRWVIIFFGAIGIPFCLLTLFNQYLTKFLGMLVILSLFDILFFSCSLWFAQTVYKPKNYFLRKTNVIYQYMFGVEDISDKCFGYGILILFFLWIYIFSYSTGNTFSQNYGYFFLYLISIVLFIIIIWNNQLKSFLKR